MNKKQAISSIKKAGIVFGLVQIAEDEPKYIQVIKKDVIEYLKKQDDEKEFNITVLQNGKVVYIS